MILFLSESEVRAALSMQDTLHIMEDAFRDLGVGNAVLLPRMNQKLPGSAGLFRTLAATLPSKNVFGLKTLTGFPGRRHSGEVYFAVLLFEGDSGALRTLISANHLTGLRTGAAGGVAARYLALPEAALLGVVGTGVQAWFQVEALCAVRAVRTAKVFSRDPAKSAAFAKRLQTELGVRSWAVARAEEAVRGSDLLAVATTATEPVVHGDWLEPGVHISAVGANTRTKQELDVGCFERGFVVADAREQVLEECGDVRHAIESGSVGPEMIAAEIGDLVTGRCPGRTSPEQITIFKSVGVALQDVAVAAELLQRAETQRFGTWLDPFSAKSELVFPQ